MTIRKALDDQQNQKKLAAQMGAAIGAIYGVQVKILNLTQTTTPLSPIGFEMNFKLKVEVKEPVQIPEKEPSKI